jgi:predicted phosphodiesterase
MPCVKGNHDEYCSIDEQLDGFNAHAAEAVNWTRRQLSEDDRQWLRDLKYFRMVTSFSMVHATLDGPQRWGYVFDKLAAAASFTYQNTSVCFFGHTHVPVAFIRDTMVRGGTYSKFKVDPSKKYFVNVGSVGQPRDNNPKGAGWSMTSRRRRKKSSRPVCRRAWLNAWLTAADPAWLNAASRCGGALA